jgi:hypothetical protein
MIERGGYDDPGYTGIGFTTANIRFSVKGSGWGFGATYENVEGYYRTTAVLANWQQISESSRLVVWLRGATIYYWYNIVGNTSLHHANSDGTNWTETYSNLNYVFNTTTTISDKALYSQYSALGAMFGGDCRVSGLGVGTNASGTTGEIRATNNITAYYSDIRLKNVVGYIENAIEKVKKLKGFYFKANDIAKDLGYDSDKVEVGVSAQDVLSVLPEIVKPAPVDSNYYTLDYSKLVPLLIEAIKEQESKIQGLYNIINEMKKSQ